MKVGFVGLGSMGYGQAMLLAKSHHDLCVYDVFARAMAPFEGKAKLASSLEELAAGREVIGICVRDEDQVNSCVDGLLPAMPAGSVLLIHSTVRPSAMQSLARRAAERQVHVLDAAVSRTIIEQDAPFVFSMTAGEEAVAEHIRPVLEVYSTDILHIGPLGSAMALKITNNLVSWCEIVIGNEAFAMAEAAGVPTDKLMTVMKQNGCLTPPMGAFVQLRSSLDKPETREFILSQSGIGEKDLMLAEAMGQNAGVTTPIGTYVRRRVRSTLAALAGQ